MKENNKLPTDPNDAVVRALMSVKNAIDLLPIAGADYRRAVVSADDALVSVISALTSGKLKVVEVTDDTEAKEQ